ncbi:MAG: hypothetical protein MR510_03170 [Clostridium sp.]|uniref:DNA-directed RNA polymerase subunit alpha C-terminal domain-containing protein n=1 Tax=Faecalicoccus sp. TaxID=1971758 RepID=UPI002A802194|nr:sigma factor-like helix-turn-helix DNA-binding protein [Faecalicoccus sp.]MCI6691485.1 hypothetical protein [Clostridium sp.]MCI7179829.1 hypothetical protein [Lachnospiraceae bacterium]MDY4501651.1 DNA-directed RNA polymerase subunit alpha C-terminal domain-containing protein [Lactobacillus johnsonii]MDY4670433.1 DNA-directed RNA polymerase subunit alpha C-terminal domain-containing protein [Oliverpabstia sp.]MDY4279411.1 DNA-directed RNA polymerase subunit alpha C-terminal domain-containi
MNDKLLYDSMNSLNIIIEKKENSESSISKKNINDIPKIDYILMDDKLINVSLAKLYGLSELFYCELKIESMKFSTRVMHRMKCPLNITYVSELLKLTYGELINVKGFGKNSFIEMDEKMRELVCNTKDDDETELSEETIEFNSGLKRFKEYNQQICNGDFSFCNNWDLSESEKKILNQLKDAYAIIDKELLIEFNNVTPYAICILDMLSNVVQKYDKQQKKRRIIKNAFNMLDDARKKCLVEGFIYAYTDDEKKQGQLRDILSRSHCSTFSSFVCSEIILDKECENEVLNFLKWCSFDLYKDIDKFMENLYENDRERIIVQARASGDTLAALGEKMNITRERVRQIEGKAKKKFVNLLNKYHLILKIYAIRNQDEILTPTELYEYFGFETDTILYLLKNTESSSYVYDKELDVFIVGETDLAERAQSYVDTLPESFSDKKIEKYVQDGIVEYDLTEEIIKKVISEEYQLTGRTYHRSRLTRGGIYEHILRYYYPDGLWVYGKKEIKEFREYVAHDYGNITLPQNDRALVAQICRAAILCGRGIYKAKESKYISVQLAKEIFEYVENSEFPIFMTNTLFSVFEDKLRAENIDNKYYLQGILHELYGDKWTFRRDYITKDNEVTSVYSSICMFVKNSVYPIKKQEIFDVFPGITEIVINFAITAPEIINLFGTYIHVDNLKITDRDLSYLRNVVYKFLEKSSVWHCKDLFEYIMNDNPVLLSNNFINFPFGLYSLLEHYFGSEFNFSRPYIAREDAEIERTDNVIRETIQASDRIEISEFQTYAKEHYHQISSILEFIDSCNETHLLINSDELASIDIIGITDKIAAEAEKMIIQELDNTEPISNLSCLHQLPRLNVEWTEWLVYSVIKKWSTMLDVEPSSNKFHQAVPMIAPKGQLVLDGFEHISVEDAGNITLADDLRNIDDLICDYILEDLGDIDEL